MDGIPMGKDNNGNKTFVRITNRNIYDKIVDIEEKLDTHIKKTKPEMAVMKKSMYAAWFVIIGIIGFLIKKFT